jgi:hypothetical protein
MICESMTIPSNLFADFPRAFNSGCIDNYPSLARVPKLSLGTRIRAYKPVGKQRETKSAMLQMDNPQFTDGERHRPETASLKS